MLTLFEKVAACHNVGDGTSRNRLLDEHGDIGECLG